MLEQRFWHDAPEWLRRRHTRGSWPQTLLAGTGWLLAVLHVAEMTYFVDSGAAENQPAAPVIMAAE